MDETRLPSPRFVKFRFGHAVWSAVAEEIDMIRPRVLRLTIIRGTWENLFRGICLRLPLAIQNHVRAWCPGYFLPSVVILKKQLKPHEDEFKRLEDRFEWEQDMYRRLEPLQGRLIPVYYGEAQCEGSRALVLSEIRGVPLNRQEEPLLDLKTFEQGIRAACRELARFRIYHDDENLSNVLLVGKRVMLVDLEMAYYEEDDRRLHKYSQQTADEFEERYGSWLYDKRHGNEC